jgi:hypothetical protein
MTPRQKIVDLLSEDKIVPVVGAGVSLATASLPNWKGLIESGLEFAKERNLDSTVNYLQAKDDLSNNRLPAAANNLRKLLSAPNYPFSEWLDDVFSSPQIKSTELADSIHRLCAPILLTTNYDTLLNSANSIYGKEVFNWKEFQLVQRAINKSSKFNLHLHGIYDKPDTIILSELDYEQLNTQSGYKAILQTLWTAKHFLFIGCSRDGVMDDDFSTVIRFFNDWFPMLPHSHYILLNEKEIKKGTHLELLRECNVTAISYGEDYDQLSTFINSINPNIGRSTKIYDTFRLWVDQEYQKALKIDAQTRNPQDNQQINRFLTNVLPTNAPWIGSNQLGVVDEVLHSYNKTLSDRRQVLSNYQNLIRGFVAISELDAKVRLWNDFQGDPSRLELRSFATLALLAYECLERVPNDILDEIRHKRTNTIHPYYFTGELHGFMLECKELITGNPAKLFQYLKKDRYFFENLKRIIQSLRGFLSVDPSQIYDDLKRATTASELCDEFIILTTTKDISLRKLDDLTQIIASLPLENNLHSYHTECIVHKGEPHILGYNSLYCFLWNPKVDTSATQYYRVEQGNAIVRVFHAKEDHTIVTHIFCSNKVVITMRDFATRDSTRRSAAFAPKIYSKQLKTFYSTETIYSNLNTGPLVNQVHLDGRSEVVLTIEEITARVKSIPFVSEVLRTNKEVFDSSSIISHERIRLKKLGEKEILSLRVQVGSLATLGDAIFLFKCQNGKLEYFLTVFIKHRSCFDLDFIKEGDRIILLFGYLHRSNEDKYLVGKAILEGDFLEINSEGDFIESKTYPGDILQVCSPNSNHCLLFQSIAGKVDTNLFDLDIESREFKILTFDRSEYLQDVSHFKINALS